MKPDRPDASIDSADECAREPIHRPGSVQPHGILFALHPRTLEIEQVSENAGERLGVELAGLIGTSFLDRVDVSARDGVRSLIRESAATFVNPFRVPLVTATGCETFDGIAHINPEGVAILELEAHPAGAPTDGLDNYLQLIQRSLAEIAGVHQVTEIAAMMVKKVRDFTGFDRVMVYRFAADFHGEVIAEARAPEMDSYLGLHYPASDIPPQARALYLTNPVRLLEDVDSVPARLFPEDNPRTGEALDMSNAVLRSMSPVHVRYLKNMGVGATLTLSLIAEGRLWGLIACHHRERRFVPYGIRATACLYASVMSAQIEVKQLNLENQQAAAARRVALRILTGFKDYADLAGSFGESLEDFIGLFAADGAAVVSPRMVRGSGSYPAENLLIASLPQLAGWEECGHYISHQAAVDVPAFAEAAPGAAGVVAIHLGEGSWLMIFREETPRTISWAGDPSPGKARDEHGRLCPRSSFAAWQETVRGQSAPWGSGAIALAAEIRTGIIELARKRNLVLERSNQELRRFAGVVAHEVKNHLHSGMMALTMLREERQSERSPELASLADVGIASLDGLAKFTSEMLDFARTESAAEVEDIEFTELASQVVEQLQLGERLDGTAIEIAKLPKVRGLKTQLFHLMTNLVRNAHVHGRIGSRPLRIEIGCETRESVGTVVYVRDNGRGIDREEHDRIFDYFYRSHADSAPGSGIGLALCAQIAKRHGQRLWVESPPAGGSAFCFTVTPSV